MRKKTLPLKKQQQILISKTCEHILNGPLTSAGDGRAGISAGNWSGGAIILV
jgi:hypothetical protein